MISIQTDTTRLNFITLVIYNALGISVLKKRFISPLFDFEYNFLT